MPLPRRRHPSRPVPAGTRYFDALHRDAAILANNRVLPAPRTPVAVVDVEEDDFSLGLAPKEPTLAERDDAWLRRGLARAEKDARFYPASMPEHAEAVADVATYRAELARRMSDADLSAALDAAKREAAALRDPAAQADALARLGILRTEIARRAPVPSGRGSRRAGGTPASEFGRSFSTAPSSTLGGVS